MTDPTPEELAELYGIFDECRVLENGRYQCTGKDPQLAVLALIRERDKWKKTEERAEAESIIGKCSCLSDYSLRNLTDPNCIWCECSEGVFALIRERDNFKFHMGLWRGRAEAAERLLADPFRGIVTDNDTFERTTT